jgi:acetoin utilization protein AcuB
MNVADIMTRKPITIHQDAPLQNALSLMEAAGCRHLPVMSSEKHLVGVISDRDCRMAMNSPHVLHERWQDEELLHKLPVRAAMTPAPIVVEPDAPATKAAELFLQHHISCLPVMREETLVGIITTSDIMMAFISQHNMDAFPHTQP